MNHGMRSPSMYASPINRVGIFLRSAKQRLLLLAFFAAALSPIAADERAATDADDHGRPAFRQEGTRSSPGCRTREEESAVSQRLPSSRFRASEDPWWRLFQARVHASAGVGLRLTLERGAPFRVDVGFSTEGVEVTAGFGLSF